MTAHDECLRRGIEAHERVAAPFGDPHDIGVVDVHGVGHRAIPRQLPLLPGRAVVAGELSRVPLADPNAAFGVTPDAAGALTGRGWCEDGRASGLTFDAADVAPGERRVVDVPVGTDRDPV